MAESSIILDKYELLEVIGDGAEGRVYKASCISDGVSGVSKGELVAVKRLKNTGQEKESQQFRRQIEILRKLNHPNIVCYKDSFVWRENELEEDIHCLVMELLDGETLKSLLGKNRGGLPWEEARVVFSQILQALQYAGKNGVVHRDLKPSNIHVTRQGIPKLVDFGIARQDDGEATATSGAAGAKGTFDYMAPDFALVHEGSFRGDEQSDIFSFGVLFYYTLTGRLPFPPLGENAVQRFYNRWLGQPPPNAEFRHPVFRVLSHARSCIAKCIDPDRQVRFRSFDEVMTDFARIGYRKLKHGAEAYEFVEWLGKGGYGEVFRARRVSDKREVAVKRLFSAGQSARFVREAKILQNAAHPNLTEYVDFVEVRLRVDEREYYLILEYLEGMPGASLRDRIKSSESGLDATEALRLFMGYLDCLEHLHRNGIIHRDIKPGNLYAPAGDPRKGKIFDLGIAHDEEGTRTHGQVPGTLDFMPPEFATQASGRGSPQSDIYSIGVTLYLSLTKKLPFPRLPEKEAEAWVTFIKRSENPLECAFDHSVFNQHPELVPLLRRALANNPKRRHASARAMRDEIQGILEGWEKKQAYDTALAAGRTALAQQDYNEAERQAGRALELIPRDKAAKQLFSQAQVGKLHKKSVAAVEERPTAVTSVSVGGEPAEEATAETRPADLKRILEYEEAVREEQKKREQAEREQAEKEKLRKDEERRQAAEARRRRIKACIPWMVKAAAVLILAVGLYYGWSVWKLSRLKQGQNYQAAMDAGQKAYDLRDYDAAIKQAEAARAIRSGDVAATKLKNDAQARQQENVVQAQRDGKYQAAMDAGQKAYGLKDYDTVNKQTDVALAIKPGDVAATKLKNDAQARQQELIVAQAERDRKYNEAMDAGQKASDRKDYVTAISRADEALKIKPGDPVAANLKSAAQTHKDEIIAQEERDRKYNGAMEAGQKAYAGQDYDKAIKQAEAALEIKFSDVAATKLKNDAQARQIPLLFGVSNFDFVWIPNLRKGKGAYVEETELSQAQYNNLSDSLAGKYRLPLSINTLPFSGTRDIPDDPKNLTYEAAAQLLDNLNKAVHQTKLQGRFQLPSRQDFLIFSEIKDSTTNPNPTYDTLASLDLFSRLRANASGSQPPRGVRDGGANKFGLFNVLGNALEWCDDKSGAGFEFDTATKKTSEYNFLFLDHKFAEGQYTGVRFLFVPDQ